MARRVADLCLALGDYQAPDARDPRWVPAPLQVPASTARLRWPSSVSPPAAGSIHTCARGSTAPPNGWPMLATRSSTPSRRRSRRSPRAWFDAMWADVGVALASHGAVAGRDEASSSRHAWRKGCSSLSTKRHSLRPGWRCTNSARLGPVPARSPDRAFPGCCERPWRVDEDISRIARDRVAMRMVVPVNILGLPLRGARRLRRRPAPGRAVDRRPLPRGPPAGRRPGNRGRAGVFTPVEPGGGKRGGDSLCSCGHELQAGSDCPTRGVLFDLPHVARRVQSNGLRRLAWPRKRSRSSREVTFLRRYPRVVD